MCKGQRYGLYLLIACFIAIPSLLFAAEQIRDGEGSGNMAGVNNDKQLKVFATTEAEVSHISDEYGQAYGGSTTMLNITTSGGTVFYLENESSTHNLIISDIWFSWSGGTSGTTVMRGILYFGTSVPTANHTAMTLGILNRTQDNSADVTAYYWDGTGNGMTVATAGNPAFYWLNEKGHYHVDVKSAIIMGKNDSLAVNLQGLQAGEASVNLYCYMREKE